MREKDRSESEREREGEESGIIKGRRVCRANRAALALFSRILIARCIDCSLCSCGVRQITDGRKGNWRWGRCDGRAGG